MRSSVSLAQFQTLTPEKCLLQVLEVSAEFGSDFHFSHSLHNHSPSLPLTLKGLLRYQYVCVHSSGVLLHYVLSGVFHCTEYQHVACSLRMYGECQYSQ